jgi:hypothetical protein
MRIEFVVAQNKLGCGPNSEAATIAIVPLGRRIYLEFSIQFQLGNAAKILFQDGCFDLKLMLIVSVLVLAATAALKIRAPRRDTQWRSFKDVICPAASESRFLLEQRRFDPFSFENKWQENRLAASVLISRQPRQALATVDQFFNCELQATILCHGDSTLALHQELRRSSLCHQIGSQVEQAQPWQAVFFQQPFVGVLLLELLDLGGGHISAIGRQFAVSIRFHRDDVLVRS